MVAQERSDLRVGEGRRAGKRLRAASMNCSAGAGADPQVTVAILDHAQHAGVGKAVLDTETSE